ALVRSSADMYLVGLLFGLGFDTATEVGLLGLAAVEAARGLSILSVLLLPALFAAGMALIDTADSFLMVGAYGWALGNPLRRRRPRHRHARSPRPPPPPHRPRPLPHRSPRTGLAGSAAGDRLASVRNPFRRHGGAICRRLDLRTARHRATTAPGRKRRSRSSRR